MSLMRGILSVGGVLIVLATAWAEKGYSVYGTVFFPEGEVICISLYTQERFRDLRNRPLPPPPFSQIIRLSPEQQEGGRADFLFTGIPAGTYALVAFRDPRIRDAPDSGGRGLLQAPLSSYSVKSVSGSWEEMKFQLDRDIRGIEIRFGEP